VAIFQDLSEATQRRSHALQTEKLASIGQLAAGVAHEINNPMGFIHANLFQLAEYTEDLQRVWRQVEALRHAAEGADPTAVRIAAEALDKASQEADIEFVLGDLAKAIRESQEGSERIRHIVQDLRDFSHQDTGERVFADLNQCLDSTANIVWPMMKHVVSLEKDYAELPPIGCYPMQLKQVFMNLLVNAFQAIEEAVGESGELGTIALSTRIEDEQVVVSIRDSGVGIAQEHLERIFDPFFTTKRVGAGTGLGLSTSFGIVQGHGGTLSVESVPGQGTTFQLRLPLDAEAPAAS
jgi:signal transduction histidine kinase